MTVNSQTRALIVIDVQEGFNQILARGVARNNPAAEVNIARLLAAARGSGVTVYHIRHSSTEADSVFAPDRNGFAVQPLAADQAGEVVIVKRVNSSFIGTDLEARLRAGGIEQVYICGATTNHCVETTTRMAGNLGFDAVLVEDACWTFARSGPDGQVHAPQDIHAMTLANLHEEFARISTTDHVVAELTA